MTVVRILWNQTALCNQRRSVRVRWALYETSRDSNTASDKTTVAAFHGRIDEHLAGLGVLVDAGCDLAMAKERCSEKFHSSSHRVPLFLLSHKRNTSTGQKIMACTGCVWRSYWSTPFVRPFQLEASCHRSLGRRDFRPDAIYFEAWSDATAFVTNKSLAMPTDIDTMAGPINRPTGPRS